MVNLSSDYIVNLIEKRLPNITVRDIIPFANFYSNTSDFVYESEVLYFGVFSFTDSSSFAYSLTDIVDYTALNRSGFTNAVLFNRLNAIKVYFTGWKVKYYYSGLIASPSAADFNTDFNSDFFI